MKIKFIIKTLNTILSNDSLSDCVTCASYIVLFAVFLVTSVIIGSFLFIFIAIQKNICI